MQWAEAQASARSLHTSLPQQVFDSSQAQPVLSREHALGCPSPELSDNYLHILFTQPIPQPPDA
jgi:hypothetical protein